MILTGGVWLELSVRTDKRLWRKSHPHSVQEAPHTYPAGQCSILCVHGVWEQKAHQSVSVITMTQHLTLAREVATWTLEDWQHVAWSDESWYRLFQADGSVRVWHRLHKALDPSVG